MNHTVNLQYFCFFSISTDNKADFSITGSLTVSFEIKKCSCIVPKMFLCISAELALKARAEIAEYLKNAKDDRARIRVCDCI